MAQLTDLFKPPSRLPALRSPPSGLGPLALGYRPTPLPEPAIMRPAIRQTLKLFEFRLHMDAGYSDRYASLMSVIRTWAPNRWEEATSSFLFPHGNTPSELMYLVTSGSTVYVDGRDMITIVDFDSRASAYIGVKDVAMLRTILGA